MRVTGKMGELVTVATRDCEVITKPLTFLSNLTEKREEIVKDKSTILAI